MQALGADKVYLRCHKAKETGFCMCRVYPGYAEKPCYTVRVEYLLSDLLSERTTASHISKLYSFLNEDPKGELVDEDEERGEIFQSLNDDIFHDIDELLGYLEKENMKLDLNTYAILFQPSSLVDCRLLPYNTKLENTFLSDFLNSEERLKLLKDFKNSDLMYQYSCSDIAQVTLSLLHFLAVNDVYLNRCKCCKSWFIPENRTDESYCRREYTNGKTCKELAARVYRKPPTLNQEIYHRIKSKLDKRAKTWPLYKQKQAIEDRDLFISLYKSYKKTMDDSELYNWLLEYDGKSDN